MGSIDASDDEAELRKAMIESSDRVFLLCDSGKFDKKAFYQICELGRIHCLITETKPSESWLSLLKRYGVEVYY